MREYCCYILYLYHQMFAYRLLQQFSFEQHKTHVGALVNFVCSLFSCHPPRRGVTEVAQLLVIVSDGRGVLSDGESVVTQAVRRAMQMGILMVFIIVDNPTNKVSIVIILLIKNMCRFVYVSLSCRWHAYVTIRPLI